MNIKSFITKKQLLKLDKELEKIDYDELIGGLSELQSEIRDIEKDEQKYYKELRIINAIINTCVELRHIYKGEED